jgi:hypothetical protein
MAAIPQIFEEAPPISCVGLNSDNFLQISVPTFLLGTKMAPTVPIIERVFTTLPNNSRQILPGIVAPVTHAGAVGDAIETFLRHVRPVDRRRGAGSGRPYQKLQLSWIAARFRKSHPNETQRADHRGRPARSPHLVTRPDRDRCRNWRLSAACPPPDWLRGQRQIIYRR